MQQTYKRIPMLKYDFNKVAKQSNFIEFTFQYGCPPLNLLHIFRTLFLKNNSGGLLLILTYRTYQKSLTTVSINYLI